MNETTTGGSKTHVETLHWASHYASQLRFVHVLSLLFLAVAADYAWILYIRWRMVSREKYHGAFMLVLTRQ
jgi:hypothetical protein